MYTGAGATVALVVAIPNAKGVQGPSAPAGMVFNGSADFAVAANNGHRAKFPIEWEE
jgi:hypothetical protein